MKNCLVKLARISCCTLLATPSFAQVAAQPSTAAAQPRTAVATKAASKAAPKTAPNAAQNATARAAGKAPADATKTADAGSRAASAAAVATSFTATGSVIVLADGIVANAAMAQIQPPADGFAYEQ